MDSWWAVLEGWSAESGTDVLVTLNHEGDTREIVLLVRKQPKLFKFLVKSFQNFLTMDLKRIESGHNRVIWRQTQIQGQGRKVIRPLLEQAVLEYR